MDHRLAAVMFADVVGYSALAARDEDAALRLVGLFHETAREEIERSGGHLIKFIGDAAFADFASTGEAVRTALALRASFPARAAETGLSGQLRIGVHVGDVVDMQGGDVFGDGVNVASRLHREAEAGQVLVSQDVWRQIRQRSGFRCRSLGERRLKGLPGGIWVFEVESTGESGGARCEEPDAAPARLPRLLATSALYLSASAVILVGTAVLAAELALPSWVLPGAMALLGVGLVVMLATAWVQATPGWERQVGQPSGWQLNFSGLRRAITERRIPSLTWARAILGGVVAFAAFFGLAAIYVKAGGRLPFPGPAVAYAEPEPALAILPFSAEGVDQALWGEGIVDLLSVTLDGLAGVRVVDPRAVLNRAGGATPSDSATALHLGTVLGARYAATGRVVASPRELSFTVWVYDTRTRERLGVARSRGAADDLPAIVGDLARQIADVAGITGSSRGQAAAAELGQLTTASVPALRAYLRGERHLRRSEWSQASAAYSEAVDADPTFALALYRLALARGWSSQPHVPRPSQYGERAERFAQQLPRRDRLLLEAYGDLTRGSQAAIPTLEEVVRTYPDDVDGWFLLGDAYYHLRLPAGSSRDFRAAFAKAIELDSTFAPAYLHLIEDAFRRGDTAGARQWIAAYRRAEPASPLVSAYDWAAALSREGEAADSLRRLERTDPEPPRGSEQGGRVGSETAGPTPPRRAAAEPRPARSPEAVPGRPIPAEGEVVAGDGLVPQETVSPEPEVEEPPAPAASAADAPPVAAGPPATEIADGVLGRLERALESEDLGAVRRVWTGLGSADSESFRNLFASVRDLSVAYEIESVESTGGQIRVRTTTTYAFYNETAQLSARQVFQQNLLLGQRDGAWVIVGRFR